jgi:hypothetical protein
VFDPHVAAARTVGDNIAQAAVKGDRMRHGRFYGAVGVIVWMFGVALIGQGASGSVSVTGCLQRNDNSGTLDTTIPESTATPETAPTLANSGEPAPGYQLAAATPLDTARDPTTLTVYVLNGSDAQLSGHLGQRVRVTGTVIPNVPKNAQVQGGANTKGNEKLKGNITRIKVSAIETVAASCPVR